VKDKFSKIETYEDIGGGLLGGYSASKLFKTPTKSNTSKPVLQSVQRAPGYERRHAKYIEMSPNWVKGSLSKAIDDFAGGRIHTSTDGVKTRYYSPDESKVVIYDNEHNYFKIYDNNIKSPVKTDGKQASGNAKGLKGEDASNYEKQQTHIKNTDK
jgi:hypothetical protein